MIQKWRVCIAILAGLFCYVPDTLAADAWLDDLDQCLEVTRSYENKAWLKPVGSHVFLVNRCIFRFLWKATNDAKEFRFYLLIAHQESHFDPMSRGAAGELGMLQVMPSTAEMVGVSKSDGIAGNVRAAVQYGKYIDKQIQQYCGALPRNEHYYRVKAASYNAGTGWLKRGASQNQPCAWEFLPRSTQEHYLPRFDRMNQRNIYKG